MSANTPQTDAPQQTSPTGQGQNQQQQQQQQAPSQGSIMPPASQNREAEEILKQADLLKDQLAQKEKAAMQDREEKDAMAQELAMFRKEKAEQAERYKKEREPQALEYIAAQEKLLGKPLDEAIKRQYMNAFTTPKFKDNADLLWTQHKHTMAIEASAKAKEEELAAVKLEKQKISETLSRANQSIGGMRSSYAQSLSTEMTPAQTEQKNAERQTAEVSASNRLRPGEIMCPAPAVHEFGFFEENGFQNPLKGNVNASSKDYDQHRTIRSSVQAAREHRLLRDEQGELQFPASMRYHFPQGFGWFVNDSGLTHADQNDFSNYVQLNSERTFTERKGVDEYKQVAI
jgi:hypothetical protein